MGKQASRLGLVLLVGFGLGGTVPARAVKPPHWDLDLTAWGYRTLLESHPQHGRYGSDDPTDLQPTLDAGKRFLDWLTVINEGRNRGKKISLSSPETQAAYPITAPNEVNARTIHSDFAAFAASAPQWFRSVVLDRESLSPELPVADEEFIPLGLTLDRLYESAARWELEAPYLDDYAQAKKQDVRGYYFLKEEPNLEAKLKKLADLTDDEQKRLEGWLVTLCFNGDSTLSECQTKWDRAAGKEGGALAYFGEYAPTGKKLWDSYFELGGKRSDVKWPDSSPDRMKVPFAPPPSETLLAFLRDNIEAEWRWQAWSLQLDFKQGAAAHLAFEPGATPHVDGVTGDTITMDENAPLTEYNVRWAIRHEFGHVLGFPDCYVEFYDESSQKMVNYQLDVTNLMCSRRGHLKATHYDELRRNYFSAKDSDDDGDEGEG